LILLVTGVVPVGQPLQAVQPSLAVQLSLGEAVLPLKPNAAIVTDAGGVIGRK
jgi:hypothetical protein